MTIQNDSAPTTPPVKREAEQATSEEEQSAASSGERDLQIRTVLAVEIGGPTFRQLEAFTEDDYAEYVTTPEAERRGQRLLELQGLAPHELKALFDESRRRIDADWLSYAAELDQFEATRRVQLSPWNAWEAACLLAGFHPRPELFERAMRYGDVDARAERISFLSERLQRALEFRQLHAPLAPDAVLRWARERNIPLREDLSSAISGETLDVSKLIRENLALRERISVLEESKRSEERVRIDYLYRVIYALVIKHPSYLTYKNARSIPTLIEGILDQVALPVSARTVREYVKKCFEQVHRQAVENLCGRDPGAHNL